MSSSILDSSLKYTRGAFTVMRSSLVQSFTENCLLRGV
ncbi:hypothetical protein T05_12535 [Trichinella murrelli]|uniref:Uncharacterized protein n=1 Tax=Trichinella murrelli TaxID=144512 RepID=A0A0V0T213_9BILA|nr:hypothetical protein T05_12535 [Trichinella murrelli]